MPAFTLQAVWKCKIPGDSKSDPLSTDGEEIFQFTNGDSWSGTHAKCTPFPVRLNVGTVLGSKTISLINLATPGLSCEKSIPIRTHRYEIRLSKSNILRFHKR